MMEPDFSPFVSVIIPIYNGEADLPDLLRCLVAQTYPRDRVEYWLVDNNSGDRTAELIRAAVAEWQPQGLMLHYGSEPQIQSSYAARNTGIKAAQGEILAFTDADCRPLANWLTDLIPPFQDEAVGIVAGEVVALPGSSLLEDYAERHETLSQKHTLANAFLPYGQTANLAIRRTALEKAGLFRPYLTTGGDADLCWRIQQSGTWQIRFVETAAVQHRHRTSLKELRKQWQRYGRSNRYLHELHGVPLMREPQLQDYLYRTTRWLGKELAIATKQAIMGKGRWSALLDTPLDLICVQARTQGQRTSKLSDAARAIEPMCGEQGVPRNVS